MAMTGMDGSRIKNFVESDRTFNAYVDKKFNALDTDHDGSLTQSELKPMVQSLGDALGLPPIGSSAETDHIYQEVFSEFSKGAAVSKDVFGRVLKDILLGLADGLERDPISVIQFDGTRLREYASSPQYVVETISVFTRLDVKQDGRLPASRLLDALPSISVIKGMPPAADPKMKGLVHYALRAARVDSRKNLDQMQFVDTLRKFLLGMADGLKTHPMKVAHSEKLYDGESIKKLLKNEEELRKALDETWRRMPKDNRYKASKDYLRVGVDEMGPAAGLPPVGSVEEVDDVLQQIFAKFNLDDGESIGQEDFEKCMMEVLGSLMLQLEGKPISIKSSKIVDE
ncbi:hypothetical protein Mapa_015492 [Marchantia paleacea]|nr:hypothetical protein Mapa_015492 [Marchantia paleacea]